MAQGCISGVSSFANIIKLPLAGNLKIKNISCCISRNGKKCKTYFKTYFELTSCYFLLLPALFLSDQAPFHFPGFSELCIGLAWVSHLLQKTDRP